MNKIESILIVGGGTAGWLAAAYLQRALDASVTITVVESSSVPTVGVGEATFPTLRGLFRFIGLEERDWMPHCNATFKLSIRYEGWRSGGDEAFYHPFFHRPEPPIQPFSAPFFPIFGEGFDSAQYWMKQVVAGDERNFAEVASSTPRLCDALKFGQPERAEDAFVYAYHFDAGMVASYLRELCVGRGVRHVVGHVVEVKQDERGFIERVITEDGTALEAQLFIDCTGFKGLLINQALEEPFVSHAQYLINDRAVAFQLPNDPGAEGLRTYTKATAATAGWTWNIPLYHRNGCGYVYSSAFCTPEAAEREVRERMGPTADGVEALHIRIRVGACRNTWVKNCIAMGLAGSFIEPLESTSIFFTEYQLAWLVALFPDRSFCPTLIRRFNDNVNDIYHQLRDFVAMHFCTTQREDTPYWRAIRHEVAVPDSLRALLDDYAMGLMPPEHQKLYIFRSSSIASVLSGMGVLPTRSPGILAHVDEAAAQRHFRHVAEQTDRLVATLPDHYAYVRSLHE